jgi:hypothetical protein
MKNTAAVDLEVFNQALLLLQNLSGEVSHVKVHPIIQTFANSIIPPEEDKCPSPTPQKSSSRKSATGQ